MLTDNLLCYYRFDEDGYDGSAGEIIDSSGNDEHGVAVGVATTAEGAKFGSHCGDLLDASNHCFNFGAIAGMGSLTAFTMSFWVKTAANQVFAAPDNGDDIFNVGFGTWAYSGKFQAYTWFTSGGWTLTAADQASLAVSDDAWYHCVYRYDGTEVSVWVNGVKGATNSQASKTTGDQSGDFTIGGRGGAGAWRGLVDDFGFWDRALSDEEVAYLYNSGDGNPIIPYQAVATVNFLKQYRRTRFPGNISGLVLVLFLIKYYLKFLFFCVLEKEFL